MSYRLALALCWFAAFLALCGLVWLGSPNFRRLYPRFQAGPCLAMLTVAPVLLLPPAFVVAEALFPSRVDDDTWTTLGAFGLLFGASFLLRAVVPRTRRAIRAFDQHLMRKPVTGEWRPERKVP